MTLRLAFMGTPAFALPTLAELIAQGHDIAAVYTQPARAAGRGQKAQPSPIEQFARDQGLSVATPQTLKSPEEQAAFAALDLDAAVVAAYGLILPQPILSAPRLGCFNVHASLLPRWRGAAPIQRAMMAGDTETGVTIMRVEAGLDTGPMLLKEVVPIGLRMTGGELHDRLSALGGSLMARALAALERGSLAETPQPDSGVTYAAKIKKEELRIDWTRSGSELDFMVRALSPAPGAWCPLGEERLRVLMAEPVAGQGVPGTLLDERLTVACGDGALRLTHVQRAGRAPMTADAFLRGAALKPGTSLG